MLRIYLGLFFLFMSVSAQALQARDRFAERGGIGKMEVA